MDATGSTKERKAKAMAVLANGPWPRSFTWGLFHTRYTHLAQVNALRTLEGLAREGKVEAYTDGTGETLWKATCPS